MSSGPPGCFDHRDVQLLKQTQGSSPKDHLRLSLKYPPLHIHQNNHFRYQRITSSATVPWWYDAKPTWQSCWPASSYQTGFKPQRYFRDYVLHSQPVLTGWQAAKTSLSHQVSPQSSCYSQSYCTTHTSQGLFSSCPDLGTTKPSLSKLSLYRATDEFLGHTLRAILPSVLCCCHHCTYRQVLSNSGMFRRYVCYKALHHSASSFQSSQHITEMAMASHTLPNRWRSQRTSDRNLGQLLLKFLQNCEPHG